MTNEPTRWNPDPDGTMRVDPKGDFVSVNDSNYQRALLRNAVGMLRAVRGEYEEERAQLIKDIEKEVGRQQ